MEFSRDLMVAFVSPKDNVGSWSPHLTVTSKGTTVQCSAILWFVLLKVHPLRNMLKAVNLNVNIQAVDARCEGQWSGAILAPANTDFVL
jgi:hypothetical protein